MKTQWLFLLVLPTLAFACPESQKYECVCVVDIQPAEQPTAATNASWVSDEKPPRTTTGEWQTGKVQIITLTPESTVDDEIAATKKWDAAHGQPPKGQSN